MAAILRHFILLLGMSDVPFTYDDFEATRTRRIPVFSESKKIRFFIFSPKYLVIKIISLYLQKYRYIINNEKTNKT